MQSIYKRYILRTSNYDWSLQQPPSVCIVRDLWHSQPKFLWDWKVLVIRSYKNWLEDTYIRYLKHIWWVYVNSHFIKGYVLSQKDYYLRISQYMCIYNHYLWHIKGGDKTKRKSLQKLVLVLCIWTNLSEVSRGRKSSLWNFLLFYDTMLATLFTSLLLLNFLGILWLIISRLLHHARGNHTTQENFKCSRVRSHWIQNLFIIFYRIWWITWGSRLHLSLPRVYFWLHSRLGD